jgi:hypothetical protein
MLEDAMNNLEQVTDKSKRHTWKTCAKNKVDLDTVSEFSKVKETAIVLGLNYHAMKKYGEGKV